jgi:hypothetical protein
MYSPFFIVSSIWAFLLINYFYYNHIFAYNEVFFSTIQTKLTISHLTRFCIPTIYTIFYNHQKNSVGDSMAKKLRLCSALKDSEQSRRVNSNI